MAKKKTNPNKTRPSHGGSLADQLAIAGFSISEEEKKEQEKRKAQPKRTVQYNRAAAPVPSGKYVGAPYNFIPFTQTVCETSLVPHNKMGGELYSGELTYEIEAKSPVFIGDGNGHFCRNAYGIPAIPGSSIRGLIRSNLQILSASSMGDDIDDYSLMYRAVGAPVSNPNRDLYKEILGSGTVVEGKSSFSILKHVKAGYLSNEGGNFLIYHTKPDTISKNLEEMNYYVLSERIIINDALENGEDARFSYLLNPRNKLTQHRTDEKFKWDTVKGRIHYRGTPRPDYTPYYAEISYEVNGRRVTAIDAPGKRKYSGYIVGTGYVQEKKALYVIPEIDPDKVTEVPQKDVRSFHIDFEKKKNNIKGKEAFYDLPEDGEKKPCFYIEYGGRLYFGFTPNLRLFYEFTIRDGLPECHRQDVIDFTKSMFGYISDSSYKSKLSFADAVLVNDKSEISEVKAVLGEPKPTSFYDYLEPNENGGAVSYNAENFSLRGSKQYWLCDDLRENKGNGNETVMTSFHPLDTGAKFEGKIRFKNLTKEELGVLLWAVRLEKGSLMNIGMAKPLGYGQIAVAIRQVRRVDEEKAYDLDELCLSPWDNDVDVDGLIDEYKVWIGKKLGVKDVMNTPTFKAFFAMKDDANKPKSDKTRYMALEEYRNRTPLPTVEQVMKKA